MNKNLLISTFSTLLFNTAIAGLLTVVGFGEGFWINFVYSQCIGLSIHALNGSVMCRVTQPRRRWLLLSFTFPGSIFLGVTLASWFTGLGDWSDPRTWIAVVIGLFFGGIGGITFALSRRIEKLDDEVKQRRLAEVESERRQLEAHLKLLQAQIEPHFLFNTLANVASLIETDPAAARQLLDRLNDWLRVALTRARSESTTLGDELAQLENYLAILAVRFGNRLVWRIEVDASLHDLEFPPMLLQPLVENAVRHGIEPKLGGGMIVLRAHREDGQLRIEVADNGAGLAEEPGGGTGLGNVRARLAALYGTAARLELDSNEGGGVSAVVSIPLPAGRP